MAFSLKRGYLNVVYTLYHIYRTCQIHLHDTMSSMEAKDFIQSIKKGEKATVVGLSGDLGAGKTTFTQKVAKELDISDDVTSPTFVIQKLYDIPSGEFRRLIHIDAYRLEGGEDLERLGFLDLLEDPDNLIMIEWPENVKDVLPSDIITLNFEFLGKVTYAK